MPLALRNAPTHNVSDRATNRPDKCCHCSRLHVQVVAELAPQEGLVLPAPVSGAAVSGLVLLLQALQLKGLLSPQQEQTLRLLAWQHDGRLMRAWDAVR